MDEAYKFEQNKIMFNRKLKKLSIFILPILKASMYIQVTNKKVFSSSFFHNILTKHELEDLAVIHDVGSEPFGPLESQISGLIIRQDIPEKGPNDLTGGSRFFARQGKMIVEAHVFAGCREELVPAALAGIGTVHIET